MNLKRLVYLGYYAWELDTKKFARFLAYAVQVTGKSRLALLTDAVVSSLKYNISLLDYFYFRFYALGVDERNAYAGTGLMYEYQLKMNPKGDREVLEDKIKFLETFGQFVKRRFGSGDALKKTEIMEALLANNSGKLVLKGSRGQVGAEVEVVNAKDFSIDSLLRYMQKKKYDLVEEFVVQHPRLMALSPSGLNTIRIFTQVHDGKLHYLGARLRITINSPVDNMAAGNPAAPIDMERGVVSGPAIYSDITKNGITTHPVTGVGIVGFQIPFWNETLQLMEKACFTAPQNRSVGWDIAISENGPELIEGNHNWCKLLWQLPVQKGLRAELQKFL